MANRIISLTLTAACILLAVVQLRTSEKPSPGPVGRASPVSFSPAADPDGQALLERPVGDLSLDKVPLDIGLRAVATKAKVNIIADWKELNGAGVEDTTEVTAHLSRATLKQALEAIARSLTATTGPIVGFYVADEIVIVTTREGATKQDVVTECLNIRPLVEELKRYEDSITPPRTPAPAPVNGGSNLFGSGQPISTYDEIIEQIAKLITDTVAADSWRDAGGTVGSLREIGGVLVISTSRENLRAVHQLLGSIHQSVNANIFTPTTQLAIRPPVVLGLAATGQPGVAITTKLFNIRPLIADVMQYQPPGPPESADPASGDRTPVAGTAAIAKIVGVISQAVAPDSWRDAGGTIGSISELGGMLVVTTTPENLPAIEQILNRLHQSFAADELPPQTPPASHGPLTVPVDKVDTDTRLAVAFINIHPLAKKFADAQTGFTEEQIIEDITALCRTIDLDSWNDRGLRTGIHSVGSVLVIRQLPENIRAIHQLIDRLQDAVAAGNYTVLRPTSTTQPDSTGTPAPSH